MHKRLATLTLRSLGKQKLSSFINIAGLAVGISVVLLISLWTIDELSFNHYHTNYRRLAVAMSVENINGSTTAASWSSVPLESALRSAFPADFKNSSLTAATSQLFKTHDKKINLLGLWAEPAFPEMMSLEIVQGSIDGLHDPSALLLSASAAAAIFGTKNPVGLLLQVGDSAVMKVVGIYRDIPENSSFAGTSFLLSWLNAQNAGNKLGQDWLDHHFQLFVELNDPTSIRAVSARIKNISKPHIKGAWEEIMLHPMDKWLLFDRFENGEMVAGRMRLVWLFEIICAFVLLLACINYMNLSTAQSETKARDGGIRRVLGADRRSIASQYLAQSIFTAVLATIIAIALAQVMIPAFNQLAGKTIVIPYHRWSFWLLLMLFTFGIGILAGVYPALYLSGMKPSLVLRPGFTKGQGNLLGRRTFIVIQFVVSMVLIISTTVVYNQIQSAKTRPVGYDNADLITVEISSPVIKKSWEALHNDLLATGAIEEACLSSSPVTAVQNSMLGYDWDGRDPRTSPVIGTVFVNDAFGKTVRWQLADGRDFSAALPADSGAFILNEAAVKFTGLQQPVGKVIRWHGRDNRIIGVVKDMVMESPYADAQPVFFNLSPNSRIHVIMLRLSHRMPVQAGLAKIAGVFRSYTPENPFQYHFTDEMYGKKFRGEEQIGKLAAVFAAFAIFISCLGLFGMASFVAEQRTREIGIRKILGASAFGIWQLLSGEFVRLVMMAMLIATPVSYLAMYRWLQNFPYHTTISPLIFVGTAMGAIVITLLTVSYQSVKSAVTNPVDALKAN